MNFEGVDKKEMLKQLGELLYQKQDSMMDGGFDEGEKGCWDERDGYECNGTNENCFFHDLCKFSAQN
jgi:hypothetical protein